VAAIIVYVYFTEKSKEPSTVGGIELPRLTMTDLSYSWSFFVAVGGAVLQTIASLMFCLGRGRSHAYTQQI
jgi:hypothetical protein